MRRYEKRIKFYRQNNNGEKNKFHRELGKSQVNFEKLTSKQIETFWTSISGADKDYNEKAEWLKREEEQYKGSKQKE